MKYEDIDGICEEVVSAVMNLEQVVQGLLSVSEKLHKALIEIESGEGDESI